MPLVSKLPPPGVDMKSSLEDLQDPAVQAQQRQPRRLNDSDEKDSGYEDFDEEDECPDSDTEASVVDDEPRPQQKKSMMSAGSSKEQALVPAIPQRNEKRASRMLDTVMLELANLDGSTSKDMETKSVLTEEDPHEKYLSSEEDASLSDDYDDSLLDTDMEDFDEDGEEAQDSRPSSRRSQQDTAKVVSFTIICKSQILEIYLHSPTERGRDSTKHENTSFKARTSSRPKSRRPSPLRLIQQQPEDDRRMSMASIASTSTARSSAPRHSTSYVPPGPSPTVVASPPRKSSRLASLKTSLSLTQHAQLKNFHGSPVLTATPPLHHASPSHAQHAFLNMDPFEAAHYQSPTREDHAPPKTPTGTTSGAWKTALSRGGLSRTLSKARKSSMPKINLAYTQGALSSSSKKDLSHTSNASVSTTNLSIHSAESGEYTLSNPHRRASTMPLFMLADELHSQHQHQHQQHHLAPRWSGTQEDSARKISKAPERPVEEKQHQQQRGGIFRIGLGRKKSTKA